jgi:hypothetical protein
VKEFWQGFRAAFTWLHWGVIGFAAGYAVAVIPVHSVNPGWVWVKVGGGGMCMVFGILMEMCRRQLRLMNRSHGDKS